MFVLHKVLDRAMGTGDAELLKRICANLRRIIDLDFIGVIKRRTTMDSQRTLLGGGKGDDMSRPERIRAFLSGLNNLDISGENVHALSEKYVSGDLDTLFPFGNQSEIAQVAFENVGNLKERFDSYLQVLHPLSRN